MSVTTFEFFFLSFMLPLFPRTERAPCILCALSYNRRSHNNSGFDVNGYGFLFLSLFDNANKLSDHGMVRLYFFLTFLKYVPVN